MTWIWTGPLVPSPPTPQKKEHSTGQLEKERRRGAGLYLSRFRNKGKPTKTTHLPQAPLPISDPSPEALCALTCSRSTRCCASAFDWCSLMTKTRRLH